MMPVPPEWREMAGGADSMHAGMILLHNGLIEKVDAALARRLGFAENELIGRHIASLFPGHDTGQVLGRSPLHSPAAQHECRSPVALAGKDGRLKHFELTVRRVDSLAGLRCTIWLLRTTDAAAAQDDRRSLAVPPVLVRRLQAIAETCPDLICICDPDSRLRFASPSIRDMLGYAEPELIGRRMLRFIHGADRRRMAQALERVLRADLPPPSEPTAFRVRHRDGSWRTLAALVRNLSARGTVSGLLLSCRDVSRQPHEDAAHDEKSRRQLHYFNQLFRLARHPSPDPAQALKRTLKMAARALGAHRCGYWTVAEDPRATCCTALYDDEAQNFADAARETASSAGLHPLMLQVCASRQPMAVDDVNRDQRAAPFYACFRAREVRAAIIAPVGQAGVLVFAMRYEPRRWRKDDVTFCAHVAGLLYAASADGRRSHPRPRTHHRQGGQTPPQPFLFAEADTALEWAAARHASLTAFFIELDGLKSVAGSVGSATAERLRAAATQRLNNLVRSDDVLAPLSGDRFMLLACGLDEARIAQQIGIQVLEAMHSPFRVDGRDVDMAAKIRIAFYPIDGTELAALIGAAQAVPYQAALPRIFQQRAPAAPAPPGTTASHPMLPEQLRKALETGDGLLHHYQPQVDLRTGRVRCVEALMRWEHPHYGLLLPSHFMPFAEDMGLVHALSRWVLNDVCDQLCAWREHGLDGFNVAINLSASQLTDLHLFDALEEALARTGVSCIRLEWEVLENTAMQRDTMSPALLDQVTQRQIGLSIDDFGAGSSSLVNLRRLPVQKVKIDSALVSGLPGHDDDCAVTDAIISLARPLGLDVVAKGVETLQQMEYLRSHGCDIAQGFYFTQPLASKQFEQWLTRH